MRSSKRKLMPSWVFSVAFHFILLAAIFFNFSIAANKKYIISSGNDKHQAVVQAMLVEEPPPAKKIKVVVASAPKPKIKPRTKTKPLVVKKNLLSSLQKDITARKKREKLKHQKYLQQQKIINAKKLKRQLLQEKIRAEGVRVARMQGQVNKYRALILQVIAQNWRVPGEPNKKLFAELLIHLAPGGAVLDVKVTRSSGNTGLDQSARAAVFRSSPLPVPKESDFFEPFRTFLLKVKPEQIRSV